MIKNEMSVPENGIDSGIVWHDDGMVLMAPDCEAIPDDPWCMYSEIFRLHNLLVKGHLQHDFFFCFTDRQFHLYFPSKEDWELLPGERPRDWCISVMEGSSTLGGSEDKLELLVQRTERAGSPFYIREGVSADDAAYRILLAEGQRRMAFHRFGVCEGTENVEDPW